ncbi:TPA: autotransporter outer membrane beta-barrel domain-containing protein [Neisseria cinerea]
MTASKQASKQILTKLSPIAMAFLAISHNYSCASQIPQITEGEHAEIHKSRQDNVADDPLFKIENGKSAVVNGASDIDLGANEHLARLNGGTLELKAEKTAPGRINFADGSDQVIFGDNKSIVKIENYHLTSEEQDKTKAIFSATSDESHELHLNNVSITSKGQLIDYRNKEKVSVFIKNDKDHVLESKEGRVIQVVKGEINGGTYIGGREKTLFHGVGKLDFTINNAKLISPGTLSLISLVGSDSLTDKTRGRLTINDSVLENNSSKTHSTIVRVNEYNTDININRSIMRGNGSAIMSFFLWDKGTHNDTILKNNTRPSKVTINDSIIDTESLLSDESFVTDAVPLKDFERVIELNNTKMTDKAKYINSSDLHPKNYGFIGKNKSKFSGSISPIANIIPNFSFRLESHSEWEVKGSIGQNSVKKIILNEGKVYFAEKGAGLKVREKVSGNGIFGLYADLSTDDINLAKNTLTFQEGWEGNFEVEIYDVGDGSFKKANGKQLINIPQNNDAHATFYRRHLKGVEELVLRKCPTGWCTYVKPRTESVVYAANSEAANNMFTLRLHDRLGNVFMQPNKSQAVWLRTIRSTHDQQLIGGESTLQGTRNGVQLGGNLYHKQTPHGNVLAGLMAGYAKYQSTAVNHETDIVANGQVKGYSLGVYGTWYQNNENHTGAYVDSWLNYNWFKNRVLGNKFREEYGSRGLTASIEAGYNFLVLDKTATNGNQYRVYIQPQLQARYMAVKGQHVEQNGTQIKPLGQDNLQSRAGIKAYLDANFMNHIEVTPFVAINSLYQSKGFGVSMDGEKRLIDNNKKAFEFEMGADVKLEDKVKLWASFATQSGKHRDKNKQGQMGLKFEF